MSPSDAAAATPTVALASLTVDEAGKDSAADRADPTDEETDRAADAFVDDGAPATAASLGRPRGEAGEQPSSSSEDGDDSKLAAMRRAAALVRDDRLLEAARVAARAGIAPPVAAMAFFPKDASASERSDAATLDRHLPAARRVSRLIRSLKARATTTGASVSAEDDAEDASEYGPWLVQGEHMGRRDVSVYYRVDKKTGSKLNARVESPIESDMLVPFLSVLNESELYASWLPDWTVPRLRVRRSEKLAQTGRVSQVVLVTVDLPWPFSAREAVLDACGVDDIDANGDICVLVDAIGEESNQSLIQSSAGDGPGARAETERREALLVPSVDEARAVRIGFEGGFLFRALPEDWDAEKRVAKQKQDAIETPDGSAETTEPLAGTSSSWFAGWGGGGGSRGAARGGEAPADPEGERRRERDANADERSHSKDSLAVRSVSGTTDDDRGAPSGESAPRRILVSVQMSVDPKIDFVPAALMNFVTRTVIYTMWCMLLRVAEGVRDGARPAHAEAIAAKKESLYDWTRARARDMVRRVFAE